MPGVEGSRSGGLWDEARAGAAGVDHLVYEVIDARDKIDAYDVAITIKEAPKGADPGSERPI